MTSGELNELKLEHEKVTFLMSKLEEIEKSVRTEFDEVTDKLRQTNTFRHTIELNLEDE